jgi:shikimate kinase
MLPNFVLIGFMGCGKSTIGRRLAGLTGHRFLDTDDAIADASQKSIPDIFSQLGEEGFRDLEQQVVQDLIGIAGIVLSSGGGTILREPNRAALKRIGIVVWLDAAPDTLFERATRTGRRPLLNTPNPRETFDTLLAARRPLYAALSDVHFDSTHTEQDDVARKVLEEAMRFRSRRN